MELDRSRTFPVARQLTSLLEKNLESLLRFIPTGMSLVSVGVEVGKEELLLLYHKENLAESPASGEVPICYYPVDINANSGSCPLPRQTACRKERSSWVHRGYSDL